jgi:hypothetical protein
MVNYQSFSIDNTDVVWAQVYHHEKSIDEVRKQIFSHLQRKIWIKDIRVEGEDILAELVNYRPDYKRYGGKFMNTSNIIRTGRWTGRVKITFKDEKYRVVLYRIEYTALQASSGSGKATIEQHPVSGTLSEFALNNFRTAFKKNRLVNLDILHLSFKDSFTLTENQVIDSDW